MDGRYEPRQVLPTKDERRSLHHKYIFICMYYRIDPGKSVIYEILRPILTELQNHASSWPFREPVNTAEVTDYLSVIKEPMDLRTMDGKLEKDSYKEIDEFINDFDLIIKNCRAYNSENTPYCKCSKNLDTFFKQKMKEKGLLK